VGNSHAAHDARHTKHNTMRQRTVEGIATLNAKRKKTLYTTTLTVSKLNGLEIQQQSATYATYLFNQVTL
jgi:hypothetical protein